MKKQTLFIFLPIFLIFFVWGLQIGDQFIQNSDHDPINQYKLETEIKVLPNNQKTILIVIVSQLDIHNPELLGIWLMTYSDTKPYTTVIPLYPIFSQNGTNNYESLIGSFKLRSTNDLSMLDDAFLYELESANISFSGYIIMDVYGFSEAIKLSGGFDTLSSGSNDEDLIAQIFGFLHDPYSSLTYQTLIFQELCNRFTASDSNSDLKILQNLFPDHLSGNISPDILMKDWQVFIKSHNGSFCIFPQTEQAAQINNK